MFKRDYPARIEENKSRKNLMVPSISRLAVKFSENYRKLHHFNCHDKNRLYSSVQKRPARKTGKMGNFLRKEHNQTGEIIDNITVEVAVLFKYPSNSNEKNETTNRGKQRFHIQTGTLNRYLSVK